MNKEKNIKKNKRKDHPRKITGTYLYNSGLFYLQRYSASNSHFRKVMLRKIDRSCSFHTGQDRQECLKILDELIDKFNDLGLLNDSNYAKASVNSMRLKGMGEKAIIQKLSVKGLERDKILEALSCHDADDLFSALRLARRKHLGPYIRAGTNTVDKKSLAVFARSGFSFETASKVLNMNYEEAEAVLDSYRL
jgi:regulatory protein